MSPRSQQSAGPAGHVEEPVRVRIPADLDTPDRVAFGLTLRQLAVVAVFAAPAYLAWQTLTGVVPLPVLAAGTAPLAALALALAVGRRDGLPLDAWLLAALRHGPRPRRLSPTGRADYPRGTGSLRRTDSAGRAQRVGVLRFPASTISADGVLTSELTGKSTGKAGSAAALVAVRTITSGLHTPAEQAALLGGYARWLNGLTGPVQVVVSSQPVDLPARALRIAERAAGLPHPALAQAAMEHAEHLLDLSEARQPHARAVTVVCTAPTTGATRASGATGTSGARAGAGSGREVLRRAERTAAALGGLSPAYGTGARVLDGGHVTGVLACAVDVYGPARVWARTRPEAVVTGDQTINRAINTDTHMGIDEERWS